MSDVIGLVLPFFGLIFMGFLVARITRQPIEALGWMNTFVIYVALPALFFQLLAKTPIERLTEWSFIFGAVFSTYPIFSLMFVASVLASRGEIAESTIKGLAAAYGNIGYMGPGLALLAFGAGGGRSGRADLLLREHHALRHRADDDGAVGRRARTSPLQLPEGRGATRSCCIPSSSPRRSGVAAAYFEFRPPVPVERFLEYLSSAAAPCALFAMGVTLALQAAEARAERACADRRCSSSTLHPLTLLRRAELDRQFLGDLGVFGGAAGGAADRDQRLRHRPAIWRLGGAGLGQHPAHHAACRSPR